MSEPKLTFYERLAIQMEYAVPLVRSLQHALGEETVKAALERHHRDDLEAAKAAARSSTGPGPDMAAFAGAAEAYAAGDALEYQVLRQDEDHFDMNVTRCAYAELMERLGARDLGPALVCNGDFAMAERAGFELERTQTRMQGASHCDFRYRRRR